MTSTWIASIQVRWKLPIDATSPEVACRIPPSPARRGPNVSLFFSTLDWAERRHVFLTDVSPAIPLPRDTQRGSGGLARSRIVSLRRQHGPTSGAGQFRSPLD